MTSPATSPASLNVLDRAIAAVAPGWGLKRAQARRQLGGPSLSERAVMQALDRERVRLLSRFRAAERSRLTHDWNPGAHSADQAIVMDSATINARARQASYDDWTAVSIEDNYRRNVVGTGITAIAAAKDENGDLLTDFNAKATRAYRYWSKRKQLCDIERRKSLVEIQGLAISELINVGQAISVRVWERRRGVSGLRLQMVEPEMLDRVLTRNHDNGNEIRAGIEIDKYSAPVAYWIHREYHPLETGHIGNRRSPASVRVPADRVDHVMRQRRVRQSHGLSRLAAILSKLRHTEMYDEYILVRTRLEAAVGGAIQNRKAGGEQYPAFPSADTITTDSDGNHELTIEPGMLLEVPDDKEVVFNTPGNPGPLYGPFKMRQIAESAAGAGLDYASVARDFSQTNYSGQRQGLLERYMETDPLQELLIDSMLRPTYEEFITMEILEGRLEAPGFFDDPMTAMRYLEADWKGPAKLWIDPAKQAQANKTNLELKLTSIHRVANELGVDWRELLREHAEARAFAAELGLTPAPAKVNPNPQPPAPPDPDATGNGDDNNDERNEDDDDNDIPPGLRRRMNGHVSM